MKKYKDLSDDEIENALMIVYGLAQLSDWFDIDPYALDKYCQTIDEVVNHCIKVKRNHYTKKKNRKWYEIWRISK